MIHWPIILFAVITGILLPNISFAIGKATSEAFIYGLGDSGTGSSQKAIIDTSASACGGYSVSPVSSDAGIEYRLYCDAFHFGTFIATSAGNLVFRPHPDQHDPNGWGTSWFMAPFLAIAVSTFDSVNSITVGSAGIQASLSGLVANGEEGAYGDWNINGTFTYDIAAQKVTSSGKLIVNLDGTLTDSGRDLNLEQLSSNYLHDVPLQSGGVGNTGDMKEAIVTYGIEDPRNFVWTPPVRPSHYPTDASTWLRIEVVGQINDVDTLKLGENFQIAVARKPTVSLVFSSADIPLSAGLAWDKSLGTDFAADNIGINHLVLKGNSAATHMSFDFTLVAFSPNPAITLITHYYVSILGRDPEPDGLAFWEGLVADQQARGEDVKPVFRWMAEFFFFSPEYLDRYTTDSEFITNLYLTFFQRTPDEDGYAWWLDQLAGGMTRHHAMSGFLYSPEFTAFMQALGF